MKFKALLVAMLVFLLAVFILLYAFAMPWWPTTPHWVKAIKGKVDPSLCGPANCEACSKYDCPNHPDECKLEKSIYSCGNSCDGGIVFCMQKNLSLEQYLAIARQ